MAVAKKSSSGPTKSVMVFIVTGFDNEVVALKKVATSDKNYWGNKVSSVSYTGITKLLGAGEDPTKAAEALAKTIEKFTYGCKIAKIATQTIGKNTCYVFSVRVSYLEKKSSKTISWHNTSFLPQDCETHVPIYMAMMRSKAGTIGTIKGV